MKNSGLWIINGIITALMIIYLIVRLAIWETGDVINSAPSWVVLIDAVYFLVPMAVVNTVWLIYRRRKK